MAIYHKMYNFFRKKIKRLNCFGSLNIQQLGGSVNSGSMQGIHGCVTAQAVHVYTKSVPPTMPPLNCPPPPTLPPSMGWVGWQLSFLEIGEPCIMLWIYVRSMLHFHFYYIYTYNHTTNITTTITPQPHPSQHKHHYEAIAAIVDTFYQHQIFEFSTLGWCQGL